MTITDDGAKNLVKAIVVRAVVDYCMARRAIEEEEERKRDPKSGSCDRTIRNAPYRTISEVERFMNGPWFEILSDYNGPELYRLMKNGEARLAYADRVADYSRVRRDTRKERRTDPSGKDEWRTIQYASDKLYRTLTDNMIRRADIAEKLCVSREKLRGMLKTTNRRNMELIESAAEEIVMERG